MTKEVWRPLFDPVPPKPHKHKVDLLRLIYLIWMDRPTETLSSLLSPVYNYQGSSSFSNKAFEDSLRVKYAHPYLDSFDPIQGERNSGKAAKKARIAQIKRSEEAYRRKKAGLEPLFGPPEPASTDPGGSSDYSSPATLSAEALADLAENTAHIAAHAEIPDFDDDVPEDD